MMTNPQPAAPLLEVRDLSTRFVTPRGTVTAVDGLSFDINPGETLAIVGESGCGKSVTTLSVLGLVPPPGRVDGGSIRFKGRELLSMPGPELAELRGRQLAMIFQDPTAALNPAFPVGRQIAETLRLRMGMTAPEARERTEQLLEQVGIQGPRRVAKSYPHQLSGGMCQRVMIAMAIACRPSLLMADEPTTSLDVTIQAQILRLLSRMQAETGAAVLLITHDLGVVARQADRVLVMYLGQAVEETDVKTLFKGALHPYTLGLLRAMPRLDGPPGDLWSIPGTVPAAGDIPPGCRFAPRCGWAAEACRTAAPPLEEAAPGHLVRCLRYREVTAHG